MNNPLPAKEQLIDLIVRIAEDENRTLPRPIDIQKRAEAELYGRGSPLDSIGLVRLVLEIETAMEDQYGVSVSLADDRAMSQERSPFRTIGSLATYIQTT